MKRTIKAIALIVVFVAGTAAVNNNDKLFEISKNIEIFVKVYKELNTNYVDEIDPSELMRTGMDAMVGSLDPYTNYISEAQEESYRLNEEGRYKGIGATLDVVDDVITIIEPFDGSPAREAGLRAGDQIININGLSTTGKNIEDLNRVMRGVPGTELNLTIHRPSADETFDLSIVRSQVTRDNVPYYGVVKDNIGYVILTTFTVDSGKNIGKAIQAMKKEHGDLDGIILDLRHNGGGLLREAIAVSNLFVPKGEIVVTTKGKVEDRDREYRTFNTPLDLEIPVAVLIDNRSASASEIVSGVIQDLDRGVLIGQRSYGKGLVQNQVDIAYNNRIKLTTAKYYIPSGRCIQSVEYENGEPVDIADERRSRFKTKNGRTVLDGGGVTPDIKMPVKKDSPLLKALKDQFLIFKYVNSYIENRDSVKSLEDFHFSNYDDFKSFLKKEEFTYQTESEKALATLREKAAEEFRDKSLDEKIGEMEEEIAKEKSKALEVERSEIIREIETEIISRYFQQSGRIQFSLLKDEEVLKAVSVLKDTSLYRQTLTAF